MKSLQRGRVQQEIIGTGLAHGWVVSEPGRQHTWGARSRLGSRGDIRLEHRKLLVVGGRESE
jgi:hypothetical protein